MSDQQDPQDPQPAADQARPARRRWSKRKKIIVWSVGVFLGLGILGSFLPNPPPTSNTSAPASPSAPTSTHAAAPPVTPPAAPPSNTTAASKPASNPVPPPAPADPLTGFGATIDAWNAHHTEDDAFAPGSVYNADPALPQVNGREGAKYTTVQPLGGRVTVYTVNFRASDLAGAQQLLAAEFPSDAHALWTQHADTCTEVEYASDTVHRLVGLPGTGDVLVVFQDVKPDGSSAPSPSSYNQAMLTDMQAATPADATGC